MLCGKFSYIIHLYENFVTRNLDTWTISNAKYSQTMVCSIRGNSTLKVGIWFIGLYLLMLVHFYEPNTNFKALFPLNWTYNWSITYTDQHIMYHYYRYKYLLLNIYGICYDMAAAVSSVIKKTALFCIPEWELSSSLSLLSSPVKVLCICTINTNYTHVHTTHCHILICMAPQL